MCRASSWMPAEPRRLPQVWLRWVQWVDMRMHEAHVGQKRGRSAWMLVTACVTVWLPVVPGCRASWKGYPRVI